MLLLKQLELYNSVKRLKKSWGLIFFQGSLKEKQSPESLFGKIAGFFFVIC